MIKTLLSELGPTLKKHITGHNKTHKLEKRVMTEQGKVCLKCEEPIPAGILYLHCSDHDFEGCLTERYFCNRQHHDISVSSGHPFMYTAAIEAASALGHEAGMIDFTEWLVSAVEANSGADLSPYLKSTDINIELGEFPPELKPYEKEYVEEVFDKFSTEIYQRLYESIVPSR